MDSKDPDQTAQMQTSHHFVRFIMLRLKYLLQHQRVDVETPSAKIHVR